MERQLGRGADLGSRRGGRPPNPIVSSIINSSGQVQRGVDVLSQDSAEFLTSYILFILCTIAIVSFSGQVLYFAARRLVLLCANDSYLMGLIVSHMILSVVSALRTLLSSNGFASVSVYRNTVHFFYVTGYLTCQLSTFALLLDRYLYIIHPLGYNDAKNKRRSKFVTVAIVAVSLVIPGILNASRNLDEYAQIKVIYNYFSFALSVSVFILNMYKNIKIYQITSHSITKQQELYFRKVRRKKIFVLLVEITMTIFQLYMPLKAALILVDKYYVSINLRRIKVYLTHSQSVVIGIYVTWYIITVKKWRFLYKKHGLFKRLFSSNNA